MTEPMIHSLEGQIADVNRKLDSIDRWRVNMQTEQDKHHKTLYGNGEPGMDEMLRALWEDLQERKKAERETQKADTRTDKEITLAGIKVSAETKIAVINGVVTILAVFLTAVLVGK